MKRVIVRRKGGYPFEALTLVVIKTMGYAVKQLTPELLEVSQGSSDIGLEEIFTDDTIARFTEQGLSVQIVDENEVQ